MSKIEDVYNERYRGDYRDCLGGYELARWNALARFLPWVTAGRQVDRLLDYGAGRGAFCPLWAQLFPAAKLHFADISSVALEKLAADFPEHAGATALIVDNRATIEDASFDLVVSIEVLEHVENLDAYLRDIRRVLRPGGLYVWTTPCGNRLSIEHLYGMTKGMIDATPEGYRRWRWEDPTHLRRMRTGELTTVLRRCGFGRPTYRMRAHLFSFVYTYLLAGRIPEATGVKLMNLDYDLFRLLPNGASMLGAAEKPAR